MNQPNSAACPNCGSERRRGTAWGVVCRRCGSVLLRYRNLVGRLLRRQRPKAKGTTPMNHPTLFDTPTCPACGSDRIATLDIDDAANCSDCGEHLVRSSPADQWHPFHAYFGGGTPAKPKRAAGPRSAGVASNYPPGRPTRQGGS